MAEPLPAQFIITAGDHIFSPVGPFDSEEAAHAYYQSNKPQGTVYLTPPTIKILLRPAPGHPKSGPMGRLGSSGYVKTGLDR